MKHDNHIVYSVTRNIHTGALIEFNFLNSFETMEQAKASLQYEADVCKYENEEECEWLSEDSLKLPRGWNPAEETLIYIDSSVDFHDRNERPFNYLKDMEEQGKALQATDIIPSNREPDVYADICYLSLKTTDALCRKLKDQEDDLSLEDFDDITETVFEAVYESKVDIAYINCKYSYFEYGLSCDDVVSLPLSE